MNDLYHLLRFEICNQFHSALDVVLSAMDRHLRVKHMQISGRYGLFWGHAIIVLLLSWNFLFLFCSATLFYIVKGRNKIRFGTPLKNHIIRTLLNGMSTHLSDDTMMRNGCLTLCQFSIPSDVVSTLSLSPLSDLFFY